jgi:hypothetical protein
MTFDCKDLERALEVQELLPDAREHAKVCPACSKVLWLWAEMSVRAPGLRQEWDSPDLWPRIRQSLEAQQKAAKPRGFDWRILVGVAAALVVAVSAWLLWPGHPAEVARQDGDLLTEQALREVERTEAAYRASIDKLLRLAEPKVNSSENPAVVASREKLLVLDSEIAEVRATVDHNRFNAQLQTQLAVLYREKQETLKEILQSGQKY